MVVLHTPHFSTKSSYGSARGCHRLQRLITSSSWASCIDSKFIALTKKEKKLSTGIQNRYGGKFSPSSVELDRLQLSNLGVVGGSAAEFGQFVARKARLDEEYLAAAWLRAECHWEGHESDRYVENYKRTFAEQEFNAMKRRHISPLRDTHKCIVMVKKDAQQSVVGTLDLHIAYLSYRETFPGEHVRLPFFSLVNGEISSRYGYIVNLCVEKSARRRGIASNMLHFAISSAKDYGAEKVFVHVHRKNKAAEVLYRKMGFEIVEAATSQLSADQTFLFCIDASNYACNIHFPCIHNVNIRRSSHIN